MKRQLEAAVANRGQSPGQVFGEKLELINTSNHYTSQPLTAEHVAALDRAKMFAFYRERFSNAADFTFFMVGAFNVDAALPLLARYVGSLPSTGQRTSDFKDVGVRFPAAIVRGPGRKGREPTQPDRDQLLRRSVGRSDSSRSGSSPRRRCSTRCCATSLREDLGQTYTVRRRPVAGAAAARRRSRAGVVRRRAARTSRR